jgi:hypothetical protein
MGPGWGFSFPFLSFPYPVVSDRIIPVYVNCCGVTGPKGSTAAATWLPARWPLLVFSCCPYSLERLKLAMGVPGRDVKRGFRLPFALDTVSAQILGRNRSKSKRSHLQTVPCDYSRLSLVMRGTFHRFL